MSSSLELACNHAEIWFENIFRKWNKTKRHAELLASVASEMNLAAMRCYWLKYTDLTSHQTQLIEAGTKPPEPVDDRLLNVEGKEKLAVLIP